jgi:hypothetical protein
MTKIELKDAKFVEDRKGRLWLPVAEIMRQGVWHTTDAEIIQVGDCYYEVMGYSFMRRSYWVSLVQIEGAADHIEEEVYADEL